MSKQNRNVFNSTYSFRFQHCYVYMHRTWEANSTVIYYSLGIPVSPLDRSQVDHSRRETVTYILWYLLNCQISSRMLWVCDLRIIVKPHSVNWIFFLTLQVNFQLVIVVANKNFQLTSILFILPLLKPSFFRFTAFFFN